MSYWTNKHKKQIYLATFNANPGNTKLSLDFIKSFHTCNMLTKDDHTGITSTTCIIHFTHCGRASYLGDRQYLHHYQPVHLIWFQSHRSTPQKAPCDQSAHDTGHISSWEQHNHHMRTCVRKVWRALKPSCLNTQHTLQSESTARHTMPSFLFQNKNASWVLQCLNWNITLGINK